MTGRLVDEYAALHASASYGATGEWALPFLLPHILALRPASLIDYGCGQSDLASRLAGKAGISRIARFDPAIPDLSEPPGDKFDALISVDVLEHIPEDELDEAVGAMAGLARHAAIVIDVHPAKLRLGDGRNAHVSLHDGAWWHDRLSRHFSGLRPIVSGRSTRIAFKTWEASLSPLHARVLTWREVNLRRCRRMVARLSGGAGVRQSSAITPL